jgi:hypothetical protein
MDRCAVYMKFVCLPIDALGGAFSFHRRCIGPTGSIDLTETDHGKVRCLAEIAVFPEGGS